MKHSFFTCSKAINLNNHSYLAHVTFAIMNRNKIATFRTPIFIFLIFEEVFHALLPYFPKILNHAHTITASVTPIQTIKSLTGHVIAFETGFNFFSPKFSAATLYDAVFVSGKTAQTVRYFTFFLGDAS